MFYWVIKDLFNSTIFFTYSFDNYRRSTAIGTSFFVGFKIPATFFTNFRVHDVFMFLFSLALRGIKQNEKSGAIQFASSLMVGLGLPLVHKQDKVFESTPLEVLCISTNTIQASINSPYSVFILAKCPSSPSAE